MKPRLAAILSIAGVLTAGSAAALVNTHVLEGTDTNDTALAASPPAVPVTSSITTLALPSTSLPGPTSTAPSSTTAATTATVPTTVTSGDAPAPPATAPAPTGSDAPTGVYRLGDGGTVTLSTAGDGLTIVAVDPAPGWEVHKAENDGAQRVEVRVRTEDREVRFEASLLFGVVSTSLETDDD